MTYRPLFQTLWQERSAAVCYELLSLLRDWKARMNLGATPGNPLMQSSETLDQVSREISEWRHGEDFVWLRLGAMQRQFWSQQTDNQGSGIDVD